MYYVDINILVNITVKSYTENTTIQLELGMSIIIQIEFNWGYEVTTFSIEMLLQSFTEIYLFCNTRGRD